MHIAHAKIGEILTVDQLAELVGLKRRQIAYLAPNIPGATRPDGYHYEYRVTPELLEWIERKGRQIQRRKQAKPSKTKTNVGVITIQGIRQEFEIWLRRVGGPGGVLKMDPDCQRDILVELRAFARLHHDINRALLNSNQH